MAALRPHHATILLAFTAATAPTACRSMTDSSILAARIELDLGALLNAMQGDFISVADRVQLVISSGGRSVTLTQTLVPGESQAAFEVEVESGEVTFSARVLGSDGVTLFEGETTTMIETDGFEVSVQLRAVSPVLVVLPAHPPFGQIPGTTPTFLFRMEVRNSGLDSLRWLVNGRAQFPDGVSVDCILPQRDDADNRCLVERAWGAGRTESVHVLFRMPPGTTSPPASGIPIISNSGNLTVPTTP